MICCPVYGGVLISENSNVHMSMCQCEGLQMGQTSGVLFEEVLCISEVSFNKGFIVQCGCACINLPKTHNQKVITIMIVAVFSSCTLHGYDLILCCDLIL